MRPVRLSGLATCPYPEGVARSPRSADVHTALPVHRHARTIARGFSEQATGHPEGEALTEAAQAIWRLIEVLEGIERRKRPGETHSMRSMRRALSAVPVRGLIRGVRGDTLDQPMCAQLAGRTSKAARTLQTGIGFQRWTIPVRMSLARSSTGLATKTACTGSE